MSTTQLYFETVRTLLALLGAMLAGGGVIFVYITGRDKEMRDRRLKALEDTHAALEQAVDAYGHATGVFTALWEAFDTEKWLHNLEHARVTVLALPRLASKATLLKMLRFEAPYLSAASFAVTLDRIRGEMAQSVRNEIPLDHTVIEAMRRAVYASAKDARSDIERAYTAQEQSGWMEKLKAAL